MNKQKVKNRLKFITATVMMLAIINTAFAAITSRDIWPDTTTPLPVSATPNTDSTSEYVAQSTGMSDGHFMVAYVSNNNLYATKLDGENGTTIFENVPIFEDSNYSVANTSYYTGVSLLPTNIEGDNDVYVTFEINNNTLSEDDVYLQRIDGDTGAVVWGFQVSPASFTSREDSPYMVPDGNGGVYFAWTSDASVYLTRINSDGTVHGAWAPYYTVDTQSSMYRIKMVTDDNNNVLLAYRHYNNSTSDDAIGFVKYTPTGSPANSNWNTMPLYYGELNMSDNMIGADTDLNGGMVFSYLVSTSDYQIKTQRIDADGNFVWNNGEKGVDVINATGSDSLYYGPQYAVSDGKGGLLVMGIYYESANSLKNYRVGYVTKDGVLADGWTDQGIIISNEDAAGNRDVYTYYDYDSNGKQHRMVSDGNGGAFFSLYMNDFTTISGTYAVLQHILNDGSLEYGPGGKIFDFTSGTGAAYPFISTNPNNTKLLFTYSKNENGSTNDIYAQAFEISSLCGYTVQDAGDSTTRTSESCLSLNLNPGPLAFENVPDNFTFADKFFSTVQQYNFSNDDSSTKGIIDITNDTDDLVTIQDLRNEGGFELQLQASHFSPIEDRSYKIPEANVYATTVNPTTTILNAVDSTLIGTTVNGAEVAQHAVNSSDVVTPIDSPNSVDTASNSLEIQSLANVYKDEGSNFDNGPVVILSGTNARIARISTLLNLFLEIPANAPPGNYSGEFTLDLIAQ
ncbi:hypothetical protein GF340_06135 [Candidatus Peregrinibacteria bacterium]|nr:hypothetical protein [Candidatus Peregrinibacteria bacterium]